MIRTTHARTPLPKHLRPLFWSYRFHRLNQKKNKKEITLSVVNYGDLEQLRWLRQTYGRRDVRDTIATLPATAFRPRALKLASLLLGLKKFPHASRRSH